MKFDHKVSWINDQCFPLLAIALILVPVTIARPMTPWNRMHLRSKQPLCGTYQLPPMNKCALQQEIRIISEEITVNTLATLRTYYTSEGYVDKHLAGKIDGGKWDNDEVGLPLFVELEGSDSDIMATLYVYFHEFFIYLQESRHVEQNHGVPPLVRRFKDVMCGTDHNYSLHKLRKVIRQWMSVTEMDIPDISDISVSESFKSSMDDKVRHVHRYLLLHRLTQLLQYVPQVVYPCT